MSKTCPCKAAAEGRGKRVRPFYIHKQNKSATQHSFITVHILYFCSSNMKIKQFIHYFDSSAIPVVYQRTCTHVCFHSDSLN